MEKIKANLIKFYKLHTLKIVLVQLFLIVALADSLSNTQDDLKAAMKLGGVTSAQVFSSQLPNPN